MAAVRRRDEVLELLAEQYTAGNLNPETYELRIDEALHASDDARAAAATWDLPAIGAGLFDRLKARVGGDRACSRLYFDVAGVGYVDLADGPRTWSIGRSSANDVLLREPLVSRRHAMVSSRGGQCTVRDLGSRHGVFLNGRRVVVATLRPGDVLSFAGAVTAHLR